MGQRGHRHVLTLASSTHCGSAVEMFFFYSVPEPAGLSSLYLSGSEQVLAACTDHKNVPAVLGIYMGFV